MNKRKSITIVVVLMIFSIVAVLAGSLNSDNSSTTLKADYTNASVGMTTLPADFMVDTSFTSHLPLVVVDLEGKEIPDAYRYDSAKEIVVPIEGVDPYVNGNIYLYAGNDVNCLKDQPQTTSGMHIKFRGNSSLSYDKKQYKIELLDEDGNKKDENLLGMGKDCDWILNISMADKSLLRNYLAYTVAGEIDEFTPDVQYCEVLFKNGSKYEYKGLYLLCESLKVSKDRVNISEYNKDGLSSYLFKRDRYDEEALMLDTWATEKGLSYGYLSLEYPKKEKLTASGLKAIENNVSAAEKVIYSDDNRVLDKYSDYIDEASFIDYFLINEFFGNYDAGNNSTYMYSELNGKIHIGPVWDFDGGMDNDIGRLAEVDKIAFHSRAWYERLTTSHKFNVALEKRYIELQRTYFNEEYMDELIDDTVNFIGNAQKRDYCRWKHSYDAYELKNSKDENGIYIDRNGYSYDEEIQKLKDYFSMHPHAMKSELIKFENETNAVYSFGKYGEWVCLCIIVFLCSAVIVRRKAL